MWSASFGAVLIALGVYEIVTGKTSPFPRRPRWFPRVVRWIGSALTSGGLGIGIAITRLAAPHSLLATLLIVVLFVIAIACLVLASRISGGNRRT